jgi:hypothetical protein
MAGQRNPISRKEEDYENPEAHFDWCSAVSFRGNFVGTDKFAEPA